MSEYYERREQRDVEMLNTSQSQLSQLKKSNQLQAENNRLQKIQTEAAMVSNELQKEQLKAQEKANELAFKKVEIQNKLADIQKEYYYEQIEIDSKMLTLAEEHAERERNITYCRWCGREISVDHVIDYLDIKVCSLHCRKMYRQHLIEEKLLIHCDCCKNDLLEKTAERDYTNVAIGNINISDNENLLITYGDIIFLDELEIQSEIKKYLDKFYCCSCKCLTEVLHKNKEIEKHCNYLLECSKILFQKQKIYNHAMHEFEESNFEEAAKLFDEISQYSDAAEKSALCKKLINGYNELADCIKSKLSDLESKLINIQNIEELNGTAYNTHWFELEDISIDFEKAKADFLDKVPENHRQYKVIAEILTTIDKIAKNIETEKKRFSYYKPANFGVICAIIFILIVLLIIISVAK